MPQFSIAQIILETALTEAGKHKERLLDNLPHLGEVFPTLKDDKGGKRG